MGLGNIIDKSMDIVPHVLGIATAGASILASVGLGAYNGFCHGNGNPTPPSIGPLVSVGPAAAAGASALPYAGQFAYYAAKGDRELGAFVPVVVGTKVAATTGIGSFIGQAIGYAGGWVVGKF